MVAIHEFLLRPPNNQSSGSYHQVKPATLTMQYPILGWGLLQTYGARLMQVENSLEDVAYKKLPETTGCTTA